MCENVINNELLISFIENNNLQIYLKFKNYNLFKKGKELIVNGINYAIILKSSSITSFINNIIGEVYKNNNINNII